MTSLAPVHGRLRKVIADSTDSRVSEQAAEIQKGLSAQKSLVSCLDVGCGGGEHPHRNLQALAYWVENRDCTVAAFGSTNDPKAIAVERMKRIENLNVRSVRTQGIVRDDGRIHTYTAWRRPAVSRPTTNAGSTLAMRSSCRSRC
jgi:SAM-dependent methyltransferase